MIVVSVCLPSDALSQHYRLIWVSLTLDVGYLFHGCSSKMQPLLLTLDVGYLLMAAAPDLGHRVSTLGLRLAPLCCSCTAQTPLTAIKQEKP